MVKLDIFELLDALEELVDSSPKIPLSSKALVNYEDVLDCIDQIRSVLPEEIRQARWVAKERDRIISEAKHDAERILLEARSRIDELAEETEVVKKAREMAEEIMEKARATSLEIRRGSEIYAEEILCKLEDNLNSVLDTIRLGREELNQSSITNQVS